MSTLSLDPSTSHTLPGRLATQLSHASLLPFVAGVVFIWLLSGRVQAEPFFFLVGALTSYAALVISFLGGLPWGLAVRVRPEDTDHALVQRTLWTGLIRLVTAWIAVNMPPHAGLVVLGALLIVGYLIDRRLYPLLGASGWLTLRFRLTIVASLSCFLAAAQL
ncbi:DUF3429 domain-containing protein [Aquabacterium soli]|uniref:DUF3429 domain-containing protein n=1 Tax=Aquabacterium soli TaxID=2493092 RepID=UPI001F1B9208|nr:DUF3429 domain-containing protein [Aquabacterium soli]